MSSFFRSPADESSEDDSTISFSEEETEQLENEEEEDLSDLSKIKTISSDGHEASSDPVPSPSSESIPTRSSSHHQAILLHALLEERCMTEALNYFKFQSSKAIGLDGSLNNPYTSDHPEVKAFAAKKYKNIAGKLATVGMVPSGFQEDKHQIERKTYVNGLQQLFDRIPQPELKFDQVNPSILDQGMSQLLLSQMENISSLPTSLQSLVSHPILNPSRYRREFTEVGLLGKGGFGKVFKAHHSLDNSQYAIKKIVLNPTRLQRIHQRGEAELNILLMELRTLAKLRHPNIVAYYGGWLEFSELEIAVAKPTLKGVEKTPARRLLEFPGYSAEETVESSIGSGDTDLFTESTDGMIGQSKMAFKDDITSSTPGLTLYIQMSLHPLTLSDFLKQHCFHVKFSLKLLLAILTGVEYLHRHKMIHRDLKPGNIFLSIFDSDDLGCIDLDSCETCMGTDQASKCQFIRPTIGDFGLVTELSRSDHDREGTEFPSATQMVGTELYRPCEPCLVSEQLDVFALGVIAFELLWRFDTKMERYEVLGNLKRGFLPVDFAAKCGERVEACIRGMLYGEEKDRFSCKQIREKIMDILEQ